MKLEQHMQFVYLCGLMTIIIIISQITDIPRYMTANIAMANKNIVENDHKKGTQSRDYEKPLSILCWVMTGEKNHKTKARAVKDTWGRHCNLTLYMSEAADDELPSTKLNTSSGREHLTAKTVQAFQFIYEHHYHQFDWFIKCDDDTYLIVENLRYLLRKYSPWDPIYFGLHLKMHKHFVKQGYNSGGAGYVIGKTALYRFAHRNDSLCQKDFGNEDLNFGNCMELLGIKVGDSRDDKKLIRFHALRPW